jgi:VWFA-related protein
VRVHSAGLLAALLLASLAAAQDGRQPVNRGDARVAVVETLVTDKKGNYLRDLTAKEFRVWEDGKEQPVTGASLHSDAASRKPEERNYMLVLFDNTSTDSERQKQIKTALAEFSADPRVPVWLGVAVYNGALSILQDFTADAGLVRKAVEDMPTPHRMTRAAGGTNSNADQDVLMARTFFIRLASLVKGMAPAPGRRALVLLVGGLYVPDLAIPEFKAAITACNQANTAIYPLDLTGLTERAAASGAPGRPVSIDTGINTREVLNTLAADTGGFVVRDSNDFAAGLRSVAAEHREYYTVAYTPTQNAKAGCRELRVRVSRRGAKVRARDSYCVSAP